MPNPQRTAQAQAFLLWLTAHGPQPLGRLIDGAGAHELALGNNRLWLRSGNSVLRYIYHQLELAGGIACDRHPLALTGDGDDGVWLLCGDDNQEAELVRFNAWSRKRRTIKLTAPLRRAAIAKFYGDPRLAILEPEPADTTGTPEPVWRLWLVDTARCEVIARHEFRHQNQTSAFKPTLIATDLFHHIHLLDAAGGRLWTLNSEGEILARHSGLPPAARAMAAHRDIVISAPSGLVRLTRANTGSRNDPARVPTFISPTLVSPDGSPGGWLRAEIEVELPEGTTLEVSCAATRDPALVQAINSLLRDAHLPCPAAAPVPG